MNAKFDITGIRLESKRLILREWELSDLDDFFEYCSVPGVGEMAGWFHHENKDKSLEILNMFINEKKTFAIVNKENNKVIGSLGIEKYGLEDKLSEFFNYKGREIGFVLSKDYWGKGLMAEAVKLVINYLFNKLDYDFLLCGHYDKNYQSKRVQEKCGFVPYRKLNFNTRMGTEEIGVMRLLVNPNKNIKFDFSHPETLIIGS
jgi:ribosomal-protein-alanine N-acetyltransferase